MNVVSGMAKRHTNHYSDRKNHCDERNCSRFDFPQGKASSTVFKTGMRDDSGYTCCNRGGLVVGTCEAMQPLSLRRRYRETCMGSFRALDGSQMLLESKVTRSLKHPSIGFGFLPWFLTRFSSRSR